MISSPLKYLDLLGKLVEPEVILFHLTIVTLAEFWYKKSRTN